MKIKKDCNVSSSDFWYDLTCGGYLKPEDICESKEDAKRITDAIAVVKDFQNSCEGQIDGFVQ